jgi:hypothetical protein
MGTSHDLAADQVESDDVVFGTAEITNKVSVDPLPHPHLHAWWEGIFPKQAIVVKFLGRAPGP